MFHGGRSFIRALALTAAKKPVLGKGHSVLGETPAGPRSCTTLRKVVSLCRSPCALAEGQKSGAELEQPSPRATQPLSPAHVCWEVICSKPRGCSVKIINRAIKEAPVVALSAMLCRGREESVASTWGEVAEHPLLLPNSFPAFRVGVSPRGRAGARRCRSLRPCSFECWPFVLLFRLSLPSVSINSFPRGSGCVWLCGNGERSHSPGAGSARGAAGLKVGFGGKEAVCSPGFFFHQPLLQHRPPPN